MKKVLFILGYLSDQDIDWIIANGERRNIDNGQTLIRAGEQVTNMYILLSGELSIRPGHAEHEELVRRFPGEIIGELSFLDSRPPTESVVAASPVSVISIGREKLNRKIKTDIPFAARFYQSLGVLLSSRFRQTMGQLTLRPDHDELDETSADELDPDLLDHISIAGHRFDMLLKNFLDR